MSVVVSDGACPSATPPAHPRHPESLDLPGLCFPEGCATSKLPLCLSLRIALYPAFLFGLMPVWSSAPVAQLDRALPSEGGRVENSA